MVLVQDIAALTLACDLRNLRPSTALRRIGLRPARIISAVVFAAALAVTGCSAHATADHPTSAAPRHPTVADTPIPEPTDSPRPKLAPTPSHRGGHGQAHFTVAPATRPGWYMTVLEDCD